MRTQFDIDNLKEELRLAREMRYEFTGCEASTVFTNAIFTFIEEAEKALKAQYALLYKESPEIFTLPEWEPLTTFDTRSVQRSGNGFKISVFQWERETDTPLYHWQITDLWGENMWTGVCHSLNKAKAEADATWAEIVRELSESV